MRLPLHRDGAPLGVHGFTVGGCALCLVIAVAVPASSTERRDTGNPARPTRGPHSARRAGLPGPAPRLTGAWQTDATHYIATHHREGNFTCQWDV